MNKLKLWISTVSVSVFLLGTSFASALPIVTVPQGGTGAATFTTGECLRANGTSAFTTIACSGGSPDWPYAGNAAYITPSSTVGVIVKASSTFSALLNMINATTTAFTNTGETWFTSLTNALLGTDNLGRLIATTTPTATVFNATNASATSTFAGNVSIEGNLKVTGNTYLPVLIASALTGLLQGNGASPVTAISDSSTAGQILRVTGASSYAWGALDLDDSDAVTGTLGVSSGGTNLSTFGGSNTILYTTSADTIAFESAFTYNASTDLFTFVSGSSTNLTISNGLKLPGATTPALTSAGYIDIVASTTGSGVTFFDNAAQRYLPTKTDAGFTWATTTATAGTTTIQTPPFSRSTTLTEISCISEGGTFVVQVGNGSASSTGVSSITGLTGTYTTLSGNNTFTRGMAALVTFGTPSATTIKQLSCNFGKTYNM